jgi:hypothetical protein
MEDRLTEEQRERLTSIRLEIKSMYEDEALPEELLELLGDVSARLRDWVT